ncbi:MAG: LacI family DNA-binding transcriptional regulator [Thermoplasmata archaeon]
MKKITQKEIAKKIGVSQTTVSAVLNNNDNIRISNELKKKILEIVSETGYWQYKKKNKTGKIAYLVPSYATLPTSDPYFYRFYSGILGVIKSNKINLVLYHLDEKEILFRKDILENFDGIIIEERVEDEIVERLKEIKPVVFLNYTSDISVDSVMPDNKGGIIKAVKYLYERGHTRIGFYGMRPFRIHQEERWEGYKEGLKILGLKYKEVYVILPERIVGGYEELDNYSKKALKTWMDLKDRPTAIVTLGDVYALSLIKQAVKLGIRIPEDLSIIGFDNTTQCELIHPSLTSINQPMEEMGKRAVELLIERIKNPDKKIEKVRFEVEIIERESVFNLNKEVKI